MQFFKFIDFRLESRKVDVKPEKKRKKRDRCKLKKKKKCRKSDSIEAECVCAPLDTKVRDIQMGLDEIINTVL